MFRPPPSSLLEALQQMIGGSQQNDLSSLFAAPMMPQEPSNPFPQGSIQNMDPNALAALEQGLSGVMNNKADMEQFAFEGNRPDLFMNQAMNDPERAPIYMEKAKVTTDRAAQEQLQRQQEDLLGAQQQQAEATMTQNLLPDLEELAPQFAQKIMSGEGLSAEDFKAMAFKKYMNEKRVFDAQKRAELMKAAADFKVTVLDSMGNPHAMPYDTSDPKHIQQRNEYLADLETRMGPGPQPPQEILGTGVTEGKREIRIDPKTGKKTAIFTPGGVTSTTADTKPTAVKPAPKTPADKSKAQGLKDTQTAAENETIGDYISRIMGSAASGAMEASPFAKAGQLLKKPASQMKPGDSLNMAMSIIGAPISMASGAFGSGAEEALSPRIPSAPIDRGKIVRDLIAKGTDPKKIAEAIAKDRKIPAPEKKQLLSLIASLARI